MISRVLSPFLDLLALWGCRRRHTSTNGNVGEANKASEARSERESFVDASGAGKVKFVGGDDSNGVSGSLEHDNISNISSDKANSSNSSMAKGFFNRASAKKTVPSPKVQVKPPTPDELKVVGNELFAEGETKRALAQWAEARKIIEAEDGSGAAFGPRADVLKSICSNLALGHLRVKDWHAALEATNAASAAPGKPDPKVLHRRALAYAGMVKWTEAEEALKDFETAGGGVALAEQTRRDWQRAKRDTAKKTAAVLRAAPKDAEQADWDEALFWGPPQLSWMPAFDLRRKGFDWEDDDLNDEVWNPDGIMGRVADHYTAALPMTVLAAASLSKLALPEEAVVHVLHGHSLGMAMDWNMVLKRLPGVKRLHVVCINLLGSTTGDAGDGLGTGAGEVTMPVEEGHIDDRIVFTCRASCGYGDFLQQATVLRHLCTPWLVIFADLPIASGRDDMAEHLEIYLSTLRILARSQVPVAMTLPGDSKKRVLRVPAQRAMASIRLSGSKTIVPWQWNRFSVPLRHAGKGTYLSAHAVLGVFTIQGGRDLERPPTNFLKALDDRRVPADCAVSRKEDDPEAEDGDFADGARGQSRAAAIKAMTESEEFSLKLAAFQKKMIEQGRPTGDQLTREEQHRQGMEFARWSASAPRSEWDPQAKEPKVEEVNEDEEHAEEEPAA